MDNLFNLVISSTIYATITGVLILTIKIFLRDKLNPKWTYILWLVFILKLVIPFGPESSISIFNKINITNQYANIVSDNLYEDNKNTLLNNFNTINKLNSKTLNSIENNDLNSNNKLYSHRYIYQNTIKYAPYIWLSTFILLILLMTASYCKLLYNLKTSTTTSRRIRYIFVNCKKKCKVDRNIELIITDTVDVPAIFGMIKPKILLPTSLSNLSDSEIEFIFIHELCHYKRKDNCLSIILLILQCIHWFNPFINYILKRARQDIEIATDYKVSSILEPKDLISYGMTILTVLSSINNTKSTPILTNMINDKKNVEERIMNIKNIMKFKENKVILTLIGVLTIGTISPLILTNSKQNIIYANTSYKTSLGVKKLDTVQNKFFELSKLLKDSSNLTISEVDEVLKETNYISKLDKYAAFVVYKYENEEIVLTKNNKNKSNVDGVTYNLFNQNKHFDMISLNSEKFDNLECKSSIIISSVSIEEIDKFAKTLNTKVVDSKLYDDYKSIISKSKNGKLDNSKFLKINPNLKVLDTESPGASYYTTNSSDYTLTLCSIDKTKELNNIFLIKEGQNGDFLELLNTYNLISVDDKTKEEYNLPKNTDFIHSLSINNKDLNVIKDLLLKSIY